MTGELLTEGDALKLYRGWNQLQPHQLPRAKERLRAYIDARKAEGEPLWPQYEADRNRAAIEQSEGLWLTETPDPAPEARDVRQFHFMSGLTGRQPYDISVEPQRYRRAVADYLGTASAGESPETFDALVRQHVQRQRDLRHLTYGTGTDDEASQPANDAALATWAAESAREGKGAAEGFAAWQEQAKGRPGYEEAQASGEGLFSTFHDLHAKASSRWRDLESRADSIITTLAAETSDDSLFISGQKALPHLSGLTRPERQAVLGLVQERAKGTDKGFGRQTGEALGRVFARLAEGMGDSLERGYLNLSAFNEDSTVSYNVNPNDPAAVVQDGLNDSLATYAGGAQFGTGAIPLPQKKLTKAQADAANIELARRRESLPIIADLRNVARGAVDPVKGSNVMTKWVYYPFLNVAGSVASFAAPGGWITNLNAYISDEQNRLESLGIDAETAAGQALFVGSLQAAADRFQLSLLSKSAAAKSLAGFLKAPSKSALGAFARRIPGALGVAAVEAGTEGVQQATPLLVQKTLAALGVDEPDVPWTTIGKEAWAASTESFFGMLPLVMMGAGIGGHRDYKAVREIVGDTQALRMLGFSEVQTDSITKAGDEETMVAALRREWPTRQPVMTAAATPAEQRADSILTDPTEDVASKAAAATFKADVESARARQAQLMAESGVSAVVRNDDGWHVVREDGSRIAVSSPQAATALMQDLKRAGSQEEADAMIAVADELAARDSAAGRKSSQTFTGDAVKATPEGVTATSPKGKVREVEFSPAALQTLAEELALLGVKSAAIQGANWIAEDGTRMYQTNQTAEGVLTQVHEFAEARFRDIMAKDGGAAAVAAAKVVAALFDPAKAKTPQEIAFAQRVQNVANARTNETEARETLVELAVADTLGRFKDGRRIAAGSIEASLRGAMEAQGGPINGVLAFFRAVKNYLRGLFGVASALHKGRRSGAIKEGDEFSTFVDKLLGVDTQKKHEAAVMKEAGMSAEAASGREAGVDGDMGFSVSTRVVDPSSYPPSAQRVIGLTNVATLTRGGLKDGEALVPLSDKPGEKMMVSPAYRRAKKEGDRQAAWDIAGDLVRVGKLAELRSALKGRRPVFVPVHQVEGREFNLLPIAAAWRLQRALGGRVDHSVRKKAQGDGNTGASAQERMTKDSTFTGPVVTAADDEAIVLVDDTFTSGSTLVALYDYFHEGGAQPAAFFTLATGRYSKNLSATPEQQSRAIDKAGISRDEFTNVFGIPISRFTGAELQSYALNGQGGIAGFRRRFGLSGGQSGGSGRASRMVPPAGGEQGELNFSLSPIREGDGPSDSDPTGSFRRRAREERENLIALKREVEDGGDDDVRFEMEATLRRLRTFSKMPGYTDVDAGSSMEEWAADALMADPKLSVAQAMAVGVERRGKQVAAMPEQDDGLSEEERLIIQEQVSNDLPYFRRLLEGAAKQIEGGSFVNLPFDAQQSIVEGLQRDVQLPVTLERNRAGTVVLIRSKVPRREPAGEKGGPSAAAPALPADATPAADPHITDGEGRRVKVPVWLAERLYDDGFPEGGADTKENILYAVAGSDGNVAYTWHSGQTAHDFMRTMAIRGEWLWKLNIVTGKAELIGGVPLRQPVEREPAEPYENETPRMAGNVPHRDPYGRVPTMPKKAIRYGQREGFVLKRMPVPDKSFAPGDVAFSLGSVNSLEAIAARFEAMAGGPEARLEIYRDTARTLEGMARAARNNEETERVLAIGVIEKERRELQRKLEDEYVEAVWRGPAGGILSAEDMATLRAQPLLDAVLRPLAKGEKGALAGRLLSRARARKAGRNLEGEFDGSEELPFWLFRGERTPDQMSQELYEEGLIDDPSPDALWSGIHSALSSAAKNREWLKKAREQIAEAKDRARTEARQWAAAERAKLATSDKRDARRALVTLDAMLMHLPAEVRDKVGGFAVLSDLKTNQAREAHFLRMVDRIDRELETYLRKQYVVAIREVIEKGKARKRPGDKDRGKLGVNTHTWLEAADAIMKMPPSRLAEREAYVAVKLGGEELSVEEITELNRQWDFGEGEDAARLALEQESALLDLFGGITHTNNGRHLRSSGELEAAWIAARDTVKDGRDAWNDTLNERRAGRAGRRAGLRVDGGFAGVDASGILRAVEERKESMKGWRGAVVRYFRKGFSFEQFIGDIFGRGSDTHRWAEDTVREAELTEAALFQQSQRETSDLLRSLWPRSNTAGRLRHLEDLSTPREVPGAAKGAPKISELQAVHLTMLWSDEDSRPWLRKYDLGDGEPTDPDGENGVDTQAALEAFLSPQAKAIRTWLQERYDAQYDVLNVVYRRLHGVNMPRVRHYAPRMVEHGKEAVVADPLGPGGLSARGVFAGFTKRRQPDLKAAPVAADALQAFVQNQRVVTHFVAWAEASLDLRAVFSSSESAPFIKAAAGEQGQADLLQWLGDLESGGVREAQASAIWRRWLRANTDNALVGKLGVLAKQIPAMYGGAAEIGWGDYLTSARRVATGTAARPVKEAIESRIMRARGFERPPEIGQAASGTGASPLTGRLRRYGVDLNRVDLTMEFLRGRIGATDAWFTARGAAIAYDAHFHDGKAQKMSDTAAHAYAERETERTVSRTAQPDSIANKSLAENHAGTFGRLLHQFQSANRQALFMTIAAFRDGGYKSGTAWRMAVTHWALTGIVTQTVGSLIRDTLSDADDDEIWNLGDYVRAILLGPLTGAVHIGPIIDAVASLFGGFERRQAAGIAAAATDIGKEFAEMLKEGDEIEWRDQEKAVRGLGLLLGGRWSALNVAENVGKQLVGFGDNLHTTEAEATEAKAKAQRKKKERDAK